VVVEMEVRQQVRSRERLENLVRRVPGLCEEVLLEVPPAKSRPGGCVMRRDLGNWCAARCQLDECQLGDAQRLER